MKNFSRKPRTNGCYPCNSAENKGIVIEESKQKATEEANRIIVSAKENIQNEKMASITDLKDQLAELSLEIARKILKKELSDPKKQEIISKN